MPLRLNALSCKLGIVAAVVSTLTWVPGESALAGRRLALVTGINRHDNLPQGRTLQKPVGVAKSTSRTLIKLGFEIETGLDVDRHEYSRSWVEFIARLPPDDARQGKRARA